MRELLGIDVPVHSGAARPLLAEPAPAADVHGASGLDGADLPEPIAAGRLRRRRRVSSSRRAATSRERGSSASGR